MLKSSNWTERVWFRFMGSADVWPMWSPDADGTISEKRKFLAIYRQKEANASLNDSTKWPEASLSLRFKTRKHESRWKKQLKVCKSCIFGDACVHLWSKWNLATRSGPFVPWHLTWLPMYRLYNFGPPGLFNALFIVERLQTRPSSDGRWTFSHTPDWGRRIS